MLYRDAGADRRSQSGLAGWIAEMEGIRLPYTFEGLLTRSR
jgi:hypothetical protein